jgi:hypothetical protein
MIEFLNEFVVFMLQVFLWYVVFCFVRAIIETWITVRVITHNREHIREQLDKVIHAVKIEKVGDMLYWYDQDSNEFLAQGKTREEIISVLKYRFNNHIFILDDESILQGPEFRLSSTINATEINIK